MTTTKRRRTSHDPEQRGETSTSIATNDNNNNTPAVSRLLLVDLQENDSNKVLSALQLFEESLNSQKRGWNWKDQQRDSLGIGAPKIVLGVLSKWPRHAEIQASGWQCLTRLSYKSRTAKSWIVREGGLEILLQAIRLCLHSDSDSYSYLVPNHPVVVLNATSCLRNLLCLESVRNNAIPRLVYEYNGLDLLVQTMNRFLLVDNVVVIVENCCVIASKLAKEADQDLQDAIVESGLVRTFGRVVEKHGDQEPGLKKQWRKFHRAMGISSTTMENDSDNTALDITESLRLL